MVISFSRTTVLRSFAHKALKGATCQREILEFVFFHQTSFDERIVNLAPRCLLCCCREGKLRKVIGALCRILVFRNRLIRGRRSVTGNTSLSFHQLLCIVAKLCINVAFWHTSQGQTVASLPEESVDAIICRIVKTFVLCVSNYSVVSASPIVLIFSASPLFRKGLFPLLHCLSVVKIPTSRTSRGGAWRSGKLRSLWKTFSCGFSCSAQSTVCFCLFCFCNFLLVLGDFCINHCIALRFRHRCKLQQRVLFENDLGGRN